MQQPATATGTDTATVRSTSFEPSRVGVLVLDTGFRPVHYNAEAAKILSYPKKPRETVSLDAVLPAARAHFATQPQPSPIQFASGRRRYRLRTFLLDPDSNGSHRPRFVVVLERECTQPVDTARWSEEFQLTGREREAAALLLRGLSSKQIAAQMRISPSTVKSFLKLIRVKVGASSRVGIVAKLVEAARNTD